MTGSYNYFTYFMNVSIKPEGKKKLCKSLDCLLIMLITLMKNQLKRKNRSKWKITVTSVTRYISGTVLAYDHDFWYICVKWWFLQAFFLFCQSLDFWVVTWVKGQKWLKMTKNSACRASYLRSHISCNCHILCTCVKWLYVQGFFFSFFWNFEFLDC